MGVAPEKAKKSKPLPPFFFWRKQGDRYLLTNDFGHYAWLDRAAFSRYSSGRLGRKDPAYAELQAKGFIRDRLDFSALAARWKSRNTRLFLGPGLHILVATLRCNHRCGYCQSGVGGPKPGQDMSLATAKKCVDLAFQTTSPGLTIEFQGGEPLLNWDVVKKTILYARGKEKGAGKSLSLGLVSNFSLMTTERAEFLLEHEVSLCTSLDGPAELHNANRPWSGGDSHGACVKWLKYFIKRSAAPSRGYRVFKPSALLTVTRASLAKPREIIDEYVSLGLEDVFVRPLSPIGAAREHWGEIGYPAADFVAFYEKTLDYVLELNRKGKRIREKFASILVEKIATERNPGYTDLDCPCGAATGQLAYDVNGDLYTCDEGRMLARGGDDIFKLGSVNSAGYKAAVSSPVSRACAAASELHSQPSCSRCAYSPYCGVCPVYNYASQGALWGNMPPNDRCAVMRGVFGALFSRLEKRRDREILLGWVKK